ncbi:PEGA domain-containing protein [Desulfoferula mesophila]|uniref:PEGA domain-containing protein n=1 Tax=Desulfoferula mesophila TaxID=3058419 RepID=A0AAU9E9B0_9BACT|nr:hypothetical protein FAK_02430 [Desulfoferula mesophilus]
MKLFVAYIVKGLRAKVVIGVALAFVAIIVVPLLSGNIPATPRCLALAATADQETRAIELLDKGEFAASSGRFTEAAHFWNLALQIIPDWQPALGRLAQLPQRRACYDAEQAARARQSRARLAFVEGVNFFNAEDYQEAARLFQACLEVFPEDELVLHHLQACQNMLRELKEGSLQVKSDPRGQVYLDGQLRGMTPIIIEGITIGRHLVSVSSCGASARRELDVKPRTLSTVSFFITGGTLEVTCQPAADIFFDGSYLGTTPLRVIGLPVGDHTLQAHRSGLASKTLSVSLRGDSVNFLKLKLGTGAKGE